MSCLIFVVLRMVQPDRMQSRRDVLVHLCGWRDWDTARAAGELRPPSLEEAGFVHLSTLGQVHLPANRIFAGRTDLVLLRIDPHKLVSGVVWEPGMPTDPPSMLFPHLYGPLPVSAVIAVEPYLPGPEGTFPEYEGSGSTDP